MRLKNSVNWYTQRVTIGENTRRLIVARGCTLVSYARLIGLNQDQLKQFVRGELTEVQEFEETLLHLLTWSDWTLEELLKPVPKPKQQGEFILYLLINETLDLSRETLAERVGQAVCTYMYQEYLDDKTDAFLNLTPTALVTLKRYMDHPKQRVLTCSPTRLHELEQKGYVSIRDETLDAHPVVCVCLGLLNHRPEVSEVPSWVQSLTPIQ